MKKNNIILFTGAIQSGKTTFLHTFYENNAKIGGFLTPDKDGKRCFIDLNSKITYPFEVSSDDADSDSIMKIGRFHFLNSTFEYGKKILYATKIDQSKLVIIDEVGPLELEDKGFGPAVLECINMAKMSNYSKKVLLVVRTNLIEKVKSKYKIREHTLLEKENWHLLHDVYDRIK